MNSIRLVFSVCLLLYSMVSFSQGNLCPSVNAGNDTVVCSLTTVQLSASTNYMNYVWTPSTGLNNPNIPNPVAMVSGDIIYTVTATSNDSNLIENGDFSMGNYGFTNDYSYSINYSPCNYYVGTTFFNSGFVMSDHTASWDGMFMSIDGCTFHSVLWEQTIPVIPSQANFDFSFWATRAGANQPIFGIYFIGNITGLEIIDTLYGIPPLNSNPVWDEYSVPTWNSGSNTSVTIRIICLTDMVMGIDFGMDDISFKTRLCSSIDSISIFYVNAVKPIMTADTSVCQHAVLPPLQAVGQNIEWYNAQRVSIGNSAPIPNTNEAGSIMYYCSQHIQGCESELDSITISIIEIPYFEVGQSLTVCTGNEIKIGPTNHSAWAYQWMDSLQNTPRYISDETDRMYVLTGENSCGSYTDSLKITWDNCLCYFYYPTTFTPNDDMHNEVFKPVYDCRVEEFKMRIFNGWGELIFETQNPEYGWTGIYRNKPAQQGIYTLQINYAALSDSKKIYKSITDKLSLIK